MNAKLLVILILLALPATGCGKAVNLGPEFEPLERIRESKVVTAGLGDSGIRTIGETAYVADLGKFRDRNPEPLFTATLLHERVHTIRQKKAGIGKWLVKYGSDPDFMLAEEKEGWHVFITHLRSKGQPINVDQAAKVLSGYKTALGKRMVSFADAKAWVQSVLNGTWTPDSTYE
jgi:hypothetical protein